FRSHWRVRVRAPAVPESPGSSQAAVRQPEVRPLGAGPGGRDRRGVCVPGAQGRPPYACRKSRNHHGSVMKAKITKKDGTVLELEGEVGDIMAALDHEAKRTQPPITLTPPAAPSCPGIGRMIDELTKG